MIWTENQRKLAIAQHRELKRKKKYEREVQIHKTMNWKVQHTGALSYRG